MPNWCGGVIKIRGKREQISAYLQDFLVPVDFLGNQLEVDVQEDEYSLTFCAKDQYKRLEQAHSLFENVSTSPAFYHWYLKDTGRAFIEQGKKLQFDFWRDEEEEEILTIEGFKQAWGIAPEDYLDLSKKHSVDIKIFGYEKGMEFTQEVEIVKGKLVKDEETEYDEYEWQVPFSDLGG
ncbi:TPA: hypothetical protein TVE77_001670 [Streptococcus equi subsp. zooepidemicus]|uniref:Uncharacterized protein n=3 Tax=Streptococcus equi TaxID=1336 RepID=A0A922NW63_9STRE|nr:hypothetical protein [Streptococcus equi]QBX24310.1 hypothetical protein Javan182_0040 [Streptococcus phage Javan182]KED05315.1 hypothetical protein CECT5772_00731 [Streptococcus equi subsp. ruminatorum CECT 5772]MCD3386887.1 hypothetical protein [Streptococcus equi subsp. zooepidemicus]HEK9981585.1 hypothetical protein [Streptococcus equi subsp. zooepidemicus]HEL0238391.1 hypothetical protein [Streptococcus equi subsp. zooepidemicus]